jgi:hypothetical protein
MFAENATAVENKCDEVLVELPIDELAQNRPDECAACHCVPGWIPVDPWRDQVVVEVVVVVVTVCSEFLVSEAPVWPPDLALGLEDVAGSKAVERDALAVLDDVIPGVLWLCESILEYDVAVILDESLVVVGELLASTSEDEGTAASEANAD